jgi:hypothetical protein
MKIRSVGPLSVGKIFAVIYGAFGVLAGLFLAFFSLVGAAFAANNPAARLPPVALGVAAIVVLPIFYGVMGFIGGVISAALYNVAARIMGGIEVDLGQ